MENKNELQKTGGGALVKINKADFVKKYNPETMLTEFRHVNTPAKAIAEDKNGLSFYSKHLGHDTVMAVIELHLLALNQSVNVGQPLTKFQIKEIAVELIATYYYLSPVEIQYVLRRAKRGEFGKLYGALNMPDILNWFSIYTEERISLYIDSSTKDRARDHSQRSAEKKEGEYHTKHFKEIFEREHLNQNKDK